MGDVPNKIGEFLNISSVTLQNQCLLQGIPKQFLRKSPIDSYLRLSILAPG